jgi:hypothetical protein
VTGSSIRPDANATTATASPNTAHCSTDKAVLDDRRRLRERVYEAFKERQTEWRRLPQRPHAIHKHVDKPEAETVMLAARAVCLALAQKKRMFDAALKVSETAANAAGADDWPKRLEDGSEAVENGDWTPQDFFDKHREDSRARAEDQARCEERAAQAGLIRDIFGNPFCPVEFDRNWRTPAVLSVAAGIYEDRAFKRLPILADALEDAGCANSEVLKHLRDPGPHVPGCWVVDLVLGRE